MPHSDVTKVEKDFDPAAHFPFPLKPEEKKLFDKEAPDAAGLIPKHLKQHFFKKTPVPDLNDYQAMGFDPLAGLAKFHQKEVCRLLVRSYLNALHYEKDYPSRILDFDYANNLDARMNHAVWDIDHGTILQLVDDSTV